MQNNVKTDIESGIDYSVPSPDRPFYLDVRCGSGRTRIWVSKEHYDAYWQDYKNEGKRLDRESRCDVPDGRGGLKKCDLKCGECPFSNAGQRQGYHVSPEYLQEEYGMEIASDEDVAASYEKKELVDALHREISLLAEKDQKVLRLFSIGTTTREIAKAVSMSQTGVAKKIRTLTAALREKLTPFR